MILYDSLQGASGVSLRTPAGAAIAIATGGTIPTSTAGLPIGQVRVSPAAAVTGVILQQGLYNGQAVWVVNEAVAANTVTFAAAGTSFVADGAGAALAGLTGRLFVWDAPSLLWYRAA
jgi:hypothetical protein